MANEARQDVDGTALEVSGAIAEHDDCCCGGIPDPCSDLAFVDVDFSGLTDCAGCAGEPDTCEGHLNGSSFSLPYDSKVGNVCYWILAVTGQYTIRYSCDASTKNGEVNAVVWNGGGVSNCNRCYSDQTPAGACDDPPFPWTGTNTYTSGDCVDSRWAGYGGTATVDI